MSKSTYMYKGVVILFVHFIGVLSVFAQTGVIKGNVKNSTEAIAFGTVFIKGTSIGASTDVNGNYTLKEVPEGEHTLVVSYITHLTQKKLIKVKSNETINVDFLMEEDQAVLDEVVVTGTMKPVSKLESPVPVEVYTPLFFKSNPTPSVYEAIQNVNGVRPQVNCAVCNTGDIHINGLEGAYTMVMIDGMPIVSGLSTVYGLSGIPQSLIERVEVVKGPASTLYGSEAVGGILNVITKKAESAPIASADLFATSWGEYNVDLASKIKVGEKVHSLLGVNYFNYQNRIDNNNDNFTDVTLQERTSVFNKWNFDRKENRVFSLAGRYVYENRFGGELQWQQNVHRGGTAIYGESIVTSRWEMFGTYQLPVKEKMMLSFSANGHEQNSVYGDMWYIGDQRIGFGQFTWNKALGNKHDLLFGTVMRYTYYDDNTPATATADSINPLNAPTHTYLPGIFVQDEIKMNAFNKVLLGMRYDNNSLHGHIFTPRVNYKWNSKDLNHVLRLSFGTGYRVANVFTEDHAALTGSREVVFEGDLNPETSWNTNINYVRKIYSKSGLFFSADATLFYTYFNNKIFADYDTDPDLIVYGNLENYAVSNGFSLNLNMTYNNLKVIAGGTIMEVYAMEDGEKDYQELTERYTGTWTVGYNFKTIGLSCDYTGNLYGPMKLPILGDNDPRPAYSPWWSIQNLQLTKKLGKKTEIYGGVKNILDWTPWKAMPEGVEMLSRPHDPFDKNVTFDAAGEAQSTVNNPLGLTFDPAYVYAPNQGRRTFIGLRIALD